MIIDEIVNRTGLVKEATGTHNSGKAHLNVFVAPFRISEQNGTEIDADHSSVHTLTQQG